MGKAIKSRGSGAEPYRVGDIVLTANETLGEKWALCNGDPMPGGGVIDDLSDPSIWNGVTDMFGDYLLYDDINDRYFLIHLNQANSIATSDGYACEIELHQYDKINGNISYTCSKSYYNDNGAYYYIGASPYNTGISRDIKFVCGLYSDPNVIGSTQIYIAASIGDDTNDHGCGTCLYGIDTSNNYVISHIANFYNNIDSLIANENYIVGLSTSIKNYGETVGKIGYEVLRYDESIGSFNQYSINIVYNEETTEMLNTSIGNFANSKNYTISGVQCCTTELIYVLAVAMNRISGEPFVSDGGSFNGGFFYTERECKSYPTCADYENDEFLTISPFHILVSRFKLQNNTGTWLYDYATETTYTSGEYAYFSIGGESYIWSSTSEKTIIGKISKNSTGGYNGFDGGDGSENPSILNIIPNLQGCSMSYNILNDKNSTFPIMAGPVPDTWSPAIIAQKCLPTIDEEGMNAFIKIKN